MPTCFWKLDLFLLQGADRATSDRVVASAVIDGEYVSVDRNSTGAPGRCQLKTVTDPVSENL